MQSATRSAIGHRTAPRRDRFWVEFCMPDNKDGSATTRFALRLAQSVRFSFSSSSPANRTGALLVSWRSIATFPIDVPWFNSVRLPYGGEPTSSACYRRQRSWGPQQRHDPVMHVTTTYLLT
jgi:hypothetical protein